MRFIAALNNTYGKAYDAAVKFLNTYKNLDIYFQTNFY